MKNKLFQPVCMAAAILALAGANDARATLLVYEDFEGYASGSSLIGQAGLGLGQSGNWTHQYTAGTFTIGAGLAGAQGLTIGVGSSGDNAITIAHTAAGWGTGEMWMSCLYNEASYVGHAYVSGGPIWAGAFGHGWSSDFGINNESGPGNVPRTLGQTYLMVAKIDWTAGSTTLWVGPQSGFDPLVQAPAVIKAEAQSTTPMLSLAFYDVVGTIDDIRIGTTSADVVPVPEPSVFALLGLGGLSLAALRRRKAV